MTTLVAWLKWLPQGRGRQSDLWPVEDQHMAKGRINGICGETVHVWSRKSSKSCLWLLLVIASNTIAPIRSDERTPVQLQKVTLLTAAAHALRRPPSRSCD